MRLFDEHVVLRFSLLLACFLFAESIPDILNFTEHVYNFIPYFLAIVFLAYVALFYKFPKDGRKIRNDVEIPEPKVVEPIRDLKKDLLEKDELFQMMIDVSSDGFWTFDVASGKVYWSNRIAKLLAAESANLEDSFEPLKNRVIESDWNAFREQLNAALQTSGTFSCNLTLLDASKKNAKLVISGRVQSNEMGRPIRVIGSLTESVDRKSAERERYNYVYQDALTGIFNRKYFLEKLKTDVDIAAKRPGYVFAVALLDVDSFGAINASYSINIGDNVLRTIADRLKSVARPDDCVARIGPDVFAVILHNIQSRDPNDDLIPLVRNIHNKVKSPIALEGKDVAETLKDDYQMRIYRGDGEFGGPFETCKLEHGANSILVNVWNWDEGWRSEVYENGKLAGQLEKLPVSNEFGAPFNGSKDWWAIGYNVGVVGRGHAPGSNRGNYCSKCLHMFKYTLKDASAKVKVVVYDRSGRKFSCSRITTADDYAELASRPQYPVEPGWEE